MNQKPKDAGVYPALAFALGFRLLVILYWLARFGGNWAEDDAARTTAGILGVSQSGQLAPTDKFVYAAGFLYQVLGTAMAQMTGLSVQAVQLWLMPLLSLAITVAGFTFYLRIFHRPLVAALAVTMLNLQGDFIYTTLRGSHEKIDYLLIFVSLLVLSLSVKWFESLRERVAMAIIYYFLILAEDTNNVFFASTFTVTLILSFLFWYGLVRFMQKRLLSLGWVVGSLCFSALATILAVAVFYPPQATAGESAMAFLSKWLFLFFAFLVLSLLISFFAQDRWSKDSILRQIAGSGWLLYVSIVSMVFVFIVVFIWYPPAGNVVALTGDLAERIRLFMITPVSASGGLLTIVNAAWILPGAWLWLRLYDIAILSMAAAGWIIMIVRLRRASTPVISPAETNNFWLLVLLPAFALQNFLFIFSDLTGQAGDINNLQIRLIPLTTIVAAPTAAFALLELAKFLRPRRLLGVLALGLTVFALFALGSGLIKGTSEPLLSNTWFFYLPGERTAVAWLNQSIPRYTLTVGQRIPIVWAGPDFRIGRLWLGEFWGASRNLIPVSSSLQGPYIYVFVSPAVRLSLERYQQSMPDLSNAGLIYDNSTVKIYFDPPELRR